MKNIAAVIFICFSTLLYAENIDVIHLNNGDIVKGEIIENVINDYIKIELQGGSIFTYSYSEVEKITKETAQKKETNQSTTSNSSRLNMQQMMLYQTQRKSKGTAMLFSIIITTGGHAYAENWRRGLVFAGAEAASILGFFILDGIAWKNSSCPGGYYYNDNEEGCYSDTGRYEDATPNLFFQTLGIASFIAFPVFRIWEIFDAGKEVTKYNEKLQRQYKMNTGFSMYIVPQKKGASLNLAYNF